MNIKIRFDKLRDELKGLERMEFSELKDKVNIIESDYEGITDDLILKIIDLKKSMDIISNIENDVMNTINKLNYEIQKLKYNNFGDDIFVEIPFPNMEYDKDYMSLWNKL